jgi:putative ABC transport system permease protein
MFDLALKDVKEHKARSFLTILGVVIAIAAIISLGSISSGMNELVGKQLKLISGIITIEEEGSYSGVGPPVGGNIPMEDIEEIENIPGVEVVSAVYQKQSGSQILFGGDLDALEVMELGNIRVKEGDWPSAGEYGMAIGSKVAEEQNLDMGDTIIVDGEELEVVGILEEINSIMDYVSMTSIETMQDVYDDPDVAHGAFIQPTHVSEIKSVANAIEDALPHLDARTEDDNLKRAKETINQIRLITLGIGFIASIVATIGIINTMFMSVSERKRQIGIMKAIGSSQKQIIFIVLQEGIIFSIIGGIVGIFFGFFGTALLNSFIGLPIAKVTLPLAAGGMLFSVFITLLASLYPAIKASQVDPIAAIRGAA